MFCESSTHTRGFDDCHDTSQTYYYTQNAIMESHNSNIKKNANDKLTKGGFFSESATRFFNLQISKKNIPKNYPELEI